MKNELHLGDCIDVLKTLPENSVDALVTDPPYGWRFMGKAWDAPDISNKFEKAVTPNRTNRICQEAGQYDLSLTANQEFQKWTELWAREVYRVLKPGAHALIFCGPRTYHRMAAGVEDAGFEVRDQLQWLFGSGFPKSLDVSKAIDKAAGAEREVVGPSAPHGGGINKVYGEGMGDGTKTNITTPATDAAKQWSGWGTALKPANEPILLGRKPISEKTVAANVTKWGTGAINVDASRVDTIPRKTGTINKHEISGRTGIYGKDLRTDRQQEYDRRQQESPTGRFPANLILSCSPHCQDDQHDIECAIDALDRQSGISKSRPHKNKTKGASGWKNSSEEEAFSPHDDSGGASRFFYCAKTSKAERNAGVDLTDPIWNEDVWQKPDLNSLTENISQLAKATSEEALTVFKQWSTDTFGNPASDQFPKGIKSTIETTIRLITELKTSNYCHHSTTKESIRVAIKTLKANGSNLAEIVDHLNRLTPSITNEKTASVLGVALAALQMLRKTSDCANYGAFHPTIKPLKLMTYLIRLITPPNGVVLDPFLGSGSTGVAAIKEGFGFIGIEREAEYMEIAKRRIHHVDDEEKD